jgi:hypothetical protein
MPTPDRFRSPSFRTGGGAPPLEIWAGNRQDEAGQVLTVEGEIWAGNRQDEAGQVLTVEGEIWTESRLQFRVRALGQTTNGTIDVAGDHARLGVTLPWPLAQIGDELQRAIQSRGTDMLEKKKRGLNGRPDTARVVQKYRRGCLRLRWGGSPA